jgi:hypothetical protein
MGSDFLFARPSFLEGVARIMDFGNSLTQYNHSLTPNQADLIVLRMDWEMVGQDMRGAIEEGRKRFAAPK